MPPEIFVDFDLKISTFKKPFSFLQKQQTNRLDRLRDLVPSATGEKLNTAGFLEAAIEHILDLRARVAAYERARQQCSDCGKRELEVAPRSPLTFPNAHLAYTAAVGPASGQQQQQPAAAAVVPGNAGALSPGGRWRRRWRQSSRPRPRAEEQEEQEGRQRQQP